jgi:GTPase SAR1 family protein
MSTAARNVATTSGSARALAVPEESTPRDVITAAPAAGAGTAKPSPAVESSESDEEDEDDARQFKVIVLGDGAVGKTSMLQRFAFDAFGKSYKQTIGCDFFSKKVELPSADKPTNAILSCWDIGGQNLSGKMLKNYIFGSHAVILACE